MDKFKRIKKSYYQYRHHYDIKKIIKILLLIDELEDQGFSIVFNMLDDIEKYGEEVVLSKEENRNKVEIFLQTESNLKELIDKEEYAIKELIESLSILLQGENNE